MSLTVEITDPENKPNESATIKAPGKSKNEEKQVEAVVVAPKTENQEKPVTPVIAAEKLETKAIAAVKLAAEVRPENNDLKPEVKSTAQPAPNAAPAAAQPLPVKSEKLEQSVLKETKQPVVAAAVPVPQGLGAEMTKLKPDIAGHIVNEKEKPTAVEAVKKELEPKMDDKNVKTFTTAAAEKPQTSPVMVKTTTTTTTVTASSSAPKKGPEQKTSLDDFSQMFAKEVVDDSEATKLAKDMKEVEIESLVKDGQDLVALLKRGRS